MKTKTINLFLSVLSGSAFLGLLIFLLVFSLTNSAEGYSAKSYNWRSDPTLRIATISFPSGSVWRSDLENGIGRWNGMWGMWLEFDSSFSNYSSFSTGDGDNNVAFLSSSDVDGAWGVTWTRYSGGDILETDIGFNADISWNTGAQDERERDESRPAFRKVVVHELGHALGLKHYCSELAQMAQGYAGHVWYGGGEKYRHHPSPDDCQGARYQYPYPSNSEIDGSLMNFEMDGSCDSHVWRSNSSLTSVSAGNTVDIEYTVCNLGNVGINFNLGIYLSTNDYISKNDIYIGGFGYYLTAHTAWERDKSFKIPCSVLLGTYYIGAVVDPENLLSEVRESNNRLVFPGRWQVTAGALDLIIERLTHSPANPTTADTITFTAVVRNIGCGKAGASTLALKVGGETNPATYPIPALGPQEGYTVHRKLVLSTAQNYLNTATADFKNEVAESDETNNRKTDAYTVINK